jgi:hypothetical protein
LRESYHQAKKFRIRNSARKREFSLFLSLPFNYKAIVGWKCMWWSGFQPTIMWSGLQKSQLSVSLIFFQALTAQQAKAEADVRVLGERKEALQQEWEMARYTM